MKRDWLQIFSNFAIIVGLVIVVYEINQSRQLAYGQMLTDTYASINDRFMTFMGDDPRASLMKAALSPDQLSSQDAVALDAYYTSIIWDWYEMIRMSEATGIERDWRSTVEMGVREHFSTEPALRWLSEWAARPPFGALPSVQSGQAGEYSSAWAELTDVALNAVDESGDSRFSFKRRYEAILGNVAVEN